jgi:uncharacterized protein (TIGR02266 family)
MAASMPSDEGRESPRVDATFRVCYRTVDELLVAYSSDLSKGGMFLSCDRFLPINAVLRLQLELEPGAAEIPIICRVVYVRDDAAARAASKPPGMGIEFLDLTSECLQLIEAFIAEKIGLETVDTPPPPARRLSVLVVDDDAGCRTLAAQPFRQRGDYVRVANDGFDALALCLKEPPDVVVSDVQMPRMDGWTLLRMVRARPTLASVPFVFLTTLGGESDRLRGYQLGVDDYIGKPFRGRELQARVDRIMERVHRQSHTLAEKKSLRGDLAQVGLPSVLSFLELERKTGELLVVGEPGRRGAAVEAVPSRVRTAHLYLRDGRLVRVDVDGLTADAIMIDLVYDVLSWQTGQFEFAAIDVRYDDRLHMTVTQLLLEHARFSDESER